MKNRFLYIALSLISVLTSCKDDEFEPLNNVAECTWHVSTDQENVSPIQLNLNNYISIMDLSQGMLSHQWVVSDDGTKFLNGKMEWGQTDYTNLIDESIPHTNDLKTIHVYFTKPGDHTVRLCNTFRSLSADRLYIHIRCMTTIPEDISKNIVMLSRRVMYM